MLYTDLLEAKKVLEISPDNPAEDGKLLFMIEWASQIIEEILNRPGIEYKTRTEYYQGNGSPSIVLRSRPVFTTPAMTVNVDQNGYYGAVSGSFGSTTELTYGQDYFLAIDQEDGSSRSGILYRRNYYWPRAAVRQRGLLSSFMTNDTGSIKITYTAGYTCDTLPAGIRYACNLLVAKMRGILPTGFEVSSESYQDRSMAFQASRKDYLMAMAKPHLLAYRNWKW